MTDATSQWDYLKVAFNYLVTDERGLMLAAFLWSQDVWAYHVANPGRLLFVEHNEHRGRTICLDSGICEVDFGRWAAECVERVL